MEGFVPGLPGGGGVKLINFFVIFFNEFNMKECAFSETQFSFCFTFEHLRRYWPIIPLPFFPNTVLEGRDGGGFDVRLIGNLFFQFKIPKLYDIQTNSLLKQWNVFGHEFYRISVKTNERQYKLLKKLISPNTNNRVYYATPDFHDQFSLNMFYHSNSITRNSSLFPLEFMPDYNSGHHHLVYSPKHNWGKLFSEPIRINKIKVIDPIELFTSYNNEATDNISFRLTTEELLRTIREIEGNAYIIPEDIFNASLLYTAHYISSVLLTRYNIHWYPILTR